MTDDFPMTRYMAQRRRRQPRQYGSGAQGGHEGDQGDVHGVEAGAAEV